MDAGILYQALIAVCPIKDVRVGLAADRSTWTFVPDPIATQPQIDAANNLITTLSTTVLSTIPFNIFISRWTTTEYSNLGKARATAITNNGAGMTLVKNWDIAQSQNSIDLNSPAAQSFKASIVSAGILTQARADAIFS